MSDTKSSVYWYQAQAHGYKGYPGTLTHDSYSLVPTKGYSMSSYFRVRLIKEKRWWVSVSWGVLIIMIIIYII